MPEQQDEPLPIADPVTRSHVFAGAPDARQAGEIRPTRFRPRYRQLTDPEIVLHDKIKARAVELEHLIDQVATDDQGEKTRYRALAMTALEQAVMWAVKGLTL